MPFKSTNPKKLGCTVAGSTAFRCVATYRHHRHRRFVIGGTGVWLCAGKTLPGCSWLRHGFVTNAQLEQHYSGQLATAALFSSRAYMAVKYDIAYPTSASGGGQTGPTTWTYVYYTSSMATVTVTISLKTGRGGYVVSGSSS